MADLIFKIFGYERKNILEILTGFTRGLAVQVTERNLDATVNIKCDNGEKAKTVLREMYGNFNDNIYAQADVPIQYALVRMLAESEMTLAVAESLTGGLVTSKLIEFPGASAFLYEGIVAYDNRSKLRRLHVPLSDIEQYGAVSARVSEAMVKGLLENKNISVAVSTTGIAGPGGGSETKPVGLVYISVGTQDEIFTEKNIFKGSREEIREKSANAALFYLYRYLKNNL